MIELRPEDRRILTNILREQLGTDVRIYAFGSRVKGRARDWSDLDLLIKKDMALPLADLYRLLDALEESELSIRVDVVDWHRITPEFRSTIESELEPIDL